MVVSSLCSVGAVSVVVSSSGSGSGCSRPRRVPCVAAPVAVSAAPVGVALCPDVVSGVCALQFGVCFGDRFRLLCGVCLAWGLGLGVGLGVLFVVCRFRGADSRRKIANGRGLASLTGICGASSALIGARSEKGGRLAASLGTFAGTSAGCFGTLFHISLNFKK